MSLWRKFALVFFVVTAHFWLLAGFKFDSAGSTSRNKTGLTQTSALPSSLATRQIVALSLAAEGSALQAVPQTTAKLDDAPVSLTKSDGTNWGGRINFLNADELDKTASLIGDFKVALEENLPVDIESVMLEFLIAKDGSTLQVKCLEGACSDAVKNSLEKLSELKFIPAIKGDQAVASRKVIQVDVNPRMGL